MPWGHRKKGAVHSVSGIMGGGKAFMEKVFWRVLCIGGTSPTPRSGHDTSGLPHQAC